MRAEKVCEPARTQSMGKSSHPSIDVKKVDTSPAPHPNPGSGPGPARPAFPLHGWCAAPRHPAGAPGCGAPQPLSFSLSRARALSLSLSPFPLYHLSRPTPPSPFRFGAG